MNAEALFLWSHRRNDIDAQPNGSLNPKPATFNPEPSRKKEIEFACCCWPSANLFFSVGTKPLHLPKTNFPIQPGPHQIQKSGPVRKAPLLPQVPKIKLESPLAQPTPPLLPAPSPDPIVPKSGCNRKTRSKPFAHNFRSKLTVITFAQDVFWHPSP